jgi:glycosyltransferase involved in cell wall biosynthesis
MTPEHVGKVVACIPAFNEERTIAKVLVRASRHVDQLVVVDDGSDDDTGIIAERLGALVIRHSKNLGKGVAIGDCFDWAAKNDVCVLITLDADGQHDPDEIPSLVSLVRAGEADIAIGYRSTRPPGMTRRRRFAQRLLDALAGVKEGETLVDSQSGFRAYSKRAVSDLKASEWSMGSETDILLQAKEAGMRIHQVPVHMRYAEGEARASHPFVQFTDVISTILKASLERRPLRVVGIPGLLLLLFGLFGWLDVLATYNATQGLALGHALVYTTILLTGIFMILAAIVVFVVRLAIQEIR